MANISFASLRTSAFDIRLSRAMANTAEIWRLVTRLLEPLPPFPGDVRFGGDRSADAVILDLIRAAGDPAGFTVVTWDRSLGDQARWLRARVERCDVFRRRLEVREEAEKPETIGDLGYWWEQFGGGREDP